MTTFQIPTQHVAGLKSLRRLEEDAVQGLALALSDAPPVYDPESLLAHMVPKMGGVAETELNAILVTLLSLCLARIRMDVSTSELADRVCGAMEQSEDNDLRLLAEECDAFKDRLVRLFNIESLTYAAKASSVMTAHDHVFVHARTLTDVRAVFGPDVEALPKAAMIIHTLEITYRRGWRNENFYVALDSQDVESLITTLQRSIDKETGLRKILEKSTVTYLKPE